MKYGIFNLIFWAWMTLMSVFIAYSFFQNEQPMPVVQPLSPVSPPVTSIPSTPSPSDQPAPSQVDFEDMAGLDAATQELLNERYQGQGPGDFERRLRRLELSVSALSDRVFGRSLLPEEGQIGRLGSDGDSPTIDK
jgi:hypothetical protein